MSYVLDNYRNQDLHRTVLRSVAKWLHRNDAQDAHRSDPWPYVQNWSGGAAGGMPGERTAGYVLQKERREVCCPPAQWSRPSPRRPPTQRR